MRKIERYNKLLEKKEDVVRRINEAKERGDQAEADRLEEELFILLSELEEVEREMSPTYSTFAEDCENDNVVQNNSRLMPTPHAEIVNDENPKGLFLFVKELKNLPPKQ